MQTNVTDSYFANYQGLNSEEIATSRKTHGKNIFEKKDRNLALRLIVEVCSEPMFILLTVTCSIYLIMGEWSEGFIMLIALAFVIGISIFQTIRSTNAVKTLRKISQTKAKVIREGHQQVISREDIVIGDLLIVEEGDLIPADSEVLQTYDFSINESLLTGEAFSIPKFVDSNPHIYLGTQVVSGYALAKVTAVGNTSQIGRLGISMEEISTGKSVLQTQIDQFVKGMAIFGGIAFVLVWLINFLSTRLLFESLLQGLTLAMSALPEEIPVAFSTFMALGAWRLIQKKVLTKRPQTVESLGSASVICLDKTGTITENKMAVEKVYTLSENRIVPVEECTTGPTQQVLKDAMLASEVQPFDPMERSIHEAYAQVTAQDIRDEVRMVHEYPLDGNPPMMTHVYRNLKDELIIACKGSWEKVLSICELTLEQKKQIEAITDQLADLGMRVLATAHVFKPRDVFPERQEDFKWIFSGLIALSDPPKKNINWVFNQFYQAGIKIKMITGDYPTTAMAIARQTGLRNAEEFLTGQQVLEMDDKQLLVKVQTTNVFARMFPDAKLKVINTLKQLGEVVAMTGDGVNDGPALKAADIGVAMGKRGTEIARKAADIILIDDNLEHMVEAISAGRKIYHNLKKAFRYIITIHIPIILVVTLPLVLGWQFPNIFSPVHVIFLELIMGPTCSIIYENEPIESHIMQSRPYKNHESLFSWRELSVSIVQGLIITLAILVIYQYAVRSGYNEELTRTMTFTTLVFSNIFLTLVNRSFEKSIFHTLQYKNILIPIILTITLLVWFSSIHFKAMRLLFQFEHISWQLIGLCLVASAAAVFWIELAKRWRWGVRE